MLFSAGINKKIENLLNTVDNISIINLKSRILCLMIVDFSYENGCVCMK